MLKNNTETYKHNLNPGKAQAEAAAALPTNPQSLMQLILNLYIHVSKINPANVLLIILFFILPWNLGKHFELASSWINRYTVPYLVPTIYLQDIVAAAALISLVFADRRKVVVLGEGHRVASRLLFVFTVACFLSVFFAGRFYPSVYFFVRLLLYFSLFVASASLFCSPSLRRWFFVSAVVNILLLGGLAFLQFYKQSSVFNNYLFFGEQPYTVYTPYIAKEGFNGVVRIPPYGTFEHPNILAGYLVVSLTLSFAWLLGRARWRVLLLPLVLVSSVTLFLTASYTAWVAAALGVLLIFFVRLVRRVRLVSLAFLLLTCAVLLAGFLLPLYRDNVALLLPRDSTTSVLSVDRRSALLDASLRMFLQQPFFGWGINSFTYSFEFFYNRPDVVRFLQPAHNVYALVAAETGVFGVLTFLLLSIYATYYTARSGGFLYSITLLQITVLSSFDHYFFTIPQTQLLFFLTLLMGLTYTKNSDCL